MSIAVLNFGSQYTHLIVRRLRELGVRAEILPPAVTLHEITDRGYEALILSGGPQDAYKEDALRLDQSLIDSDLPILGICYGHQLLAIQNGGKVRRNDAGEYGLKKVTVQTNSPLFQGLPSTINVWMSHSDTVIEIPEWASPIAHTDQDQYTAIQYSSTRFSVQFHPEVYHTEFGTKILDNFVNVSMIERNWDSQAIYNEVFDNIPDVDGNILLGVSGGVDSTVVAQILHQKFPDQLHCVFVDTGLMREKEPEYVANLFHSLGFKHFHHVDAKDLFLKRLEGVVDPEEKRKIIGKTFIEVFEQKAKEIQNQFGPFEYLGQGTIYPDRIESSEPGVHSHVIKSHHNVGGLPEKMELKLLEPIKELYKDEVRILGKKLGVPEEFLKRQPFPGPGLAVRIIGDVTKEKLRIVRKADRILHEVLEEAGLTNHIWQFFAAYLPISSVGVMGDARTYDAAIAVRMVDSIDGMTADIVNIPKEVLVTISSRIVNEVNGVNRVFYDITQKPPATIELE